MLRERPLCPTTLGGYESGEDVILQQMKTIHPTSYIQDELQHNRDMIPATVIDTMRTLLQHLMDSGLELGDDANKKYAEIFFWQCTSRACSGN